MTEGFIEFEFDLPDALLVSLVRACDGMQAASLTPAAAGVIPEQQGIYQLFHREKMVYIGKTDADAGLRKRLERHARTIQHRKNLVPTDVTFKAVRIFVFTAIDLESQLIAHYSADGNLPWNKSGFGSNDPGRNRDDTDLSAAAFDAQYPIDLDHAIELSIPVGVTAAEALTTLRSALPYTLRFEGGRRHPHHDLASATLNTPLSEPLTTRSMLLAILASLPKGWQATALAGRIILYKEVRNYRHGIVIGRS